MSRAAGLAVLAGLLAIMGGGAPAAEPPAKRRLTDVEKGSIYNKIDSCTSAEIGLVAIREFVQKVVRMAKGRDDAVDYIVKSCLIHTEPLARIATVEALAHIGSGRALPALHELIEFDDTYSVRRHAARAIAGFGDPVALKKLFREVPDFDGSLGRRIRGPKGESRAAAARRKKRLRALGATISRALDRFPSLIHYMRPNEDRDLQEKAKKELQRLTDYVDQVKAEEWRRWWKEVRKGRPPKLHVGINRTADRTTMMALIELAAMIEVRETVGGLIAALGHGEVPVKMAAAGALGHLGTGGGEDKKRISDALRKALGDPNGWIKAAAAKALTSCDAKNSTAAFRGLLADWAPREKSATHRAMLSRVRRAAVAGLRAAEARGVEAEIAGLLADPKASRLLEWEVVSALEELGSPRELAVLARCAAAGNARERDHALRSAAAIIARRPPAAGGEKLSGMSTVKLIALARGGKSFLAVAAVHELDRRGPSLTEAGFLTGLKSAPAEARLLAIALLVRRKWVPAVRELAAAARASAGAADPAVVLAACRAAAELSSPKAIAGYLKDPPAGAEPLTAQDIADRRRKAVGSLLKLLGTPKLRPALASAASDALVKILPPNEVGLRQGVLAGLIDALGRERLREAHPEFGAALRELTGEDFPDDVRPWRRKYGPKKRPGGAAGS